MGYAVKLQGGVAIQKGTIKGYMRYLDAPITPVDYNSKRPFVAKHCIMLYGLNASCTNYTICYVNSDAYSKSQQNIDGNSTSGLYGGSFSIYDDMYENIYSAKFIQTSYGGGILATSFDLEYHHVRYNTETNPYVFTKDWNYVYAAKPFVGTTGYYPTLNGNYITNWGAPDYSSSNRGIFEKLLTNIKAGDEIRAVNVYSSMFLICFDRL